MLATIADLMDITGKTYSDDEVWQLTTMLTIVSREIQIETGRKIERQVLVWKPVFAWKLKLPENVEPYLISVKDQSGQNLPYIYDGVENIWITNPTLIAFDMTFTPALWYNTRITVTYEAGYSIVPADIKAICCQMALRAYGSDPLKSGMTQEAITNYSYQQGQAAAAGAIGMLPMEKAALAPYKRPHTSISTAPGNF